ncbi:unnamed protein product [Allacma fusca]|uniref:Uncharacterized protein n=1 Tax=Allacma fusca TaxID=39272 RepID=A0A8J2KY57_9HEXA|nr:unnamed protein product [Allacma fusca]
MRSHCNKCGEGNCEDFEKTDFEKYPQHGRGCAYCGCAPGQHELVLITSVDESARLSVIAATGDLSGRRISDPGSSASAVADDASVNEGIASTCFATNCDRDAAPVIASKRTIEEQVRRMESTEKAAKTNSFNQTRPGAKKKDLEKLQSLQQMPAVTFSREIMTYINDDITRVWAKIIKETYDYYRKFDIGNRLDYEVVGEKVFINYPQINIKTRESKTAWSIFTASLSCYVRKQRRLERNGGGQANNESFIVEDFRCIELVACARRTRPKVTNTDFSGIGAKKSRMLLLFSQESVDEIELITLMRETYEDRSNSIFGNVYPARIFENYPMLACPTYIRCEAETLYPKQDQIKMFQNCTAFVRAVTMMNTLNEGIQASFRNYFLVMNGKEDFIKFYSNDEEMFEDLVPHWRAPPIMRVSISDKKVSLIRIYIGNFHIDHTRDLAEGLLLFVLILHSFFMNFPTKYGHGLKVLEAFILGSSPSDLGKDQEAYFKKMVECLPRLDFQEDQSDAFVFQDDDVKHRSDGNLKLRCKLHNTQFDTLQRFEDHCKIVHKLQVHEYDKVLHIDRANDGIDSENYINTTTKETLLFTLELESRFQLGQVGVQFVIENMASIIKTAKEKNEELEIKKIASEHKRRSIFGKRYALVQPQQVTLGMIRNKRSVSYKRKKNARWPTVSTKAISEWKPNLGYVIPLRELLNFLLQIPQYIRCCNATGDPVIARRNGIYVSDPCDDIRTIYLAISIDEIEIVNPIGTNTKKHKITIGCVEILNLLPQFRSALQAKHLLFVAKTMHLKTDHGLFAILGDFVRTLNSGADGMPLGPSKQLFRLKFMYATADSPANAFLYGFKEAVGPALKFCRTCEISRENISQGFNDQNYTMRTLDSHLRSLSQIEQADSLRRSEIQKATGIVRRSPLLDIHDFSLRSGIHDVMHVLLEGGVLACCTQWFLNYLIKGKARLTMDQLNQIVLTWNYFDYDVRNKPRKLDERIINPKTKINMTAMSLYVFAQELLFMLHPFLQPEDEPHVLNFSRILHITQFFLFSNTYTDESLHTLRLLIAHFMHVYVELYPEAKVNPKHHFLTHLILMILEFGPSRHLSCLRFEAKYGLFKLRKWKNFLNVPFSLASFHQKWLLSKVISSEGSTTNQFINFGVEIVHSVKYQVSHVPYRFSHLLVQTYDEFVETLSVGSHTLNRNSVLEISNATDDIPEFCKLYGVLRKGDELYAMVDIYLEAVFVPEVCAYQVSGSEPAIITLPEAEEILIDLNERQTRQDLTLHDKPPVDISMESTETTQINTGGLQNDNSETPQNLLSENGCTPPKDQSNPVGPNHLSKNESFLFAMQESVLIQETDRISNASEEVSVLKDLDNNMKSSEIYTTEVNQNRSTEETTSLEGLSSQQLPPLIRQASLASNFETSVDVHLESFNHLSTATFTESDVNVSALRQKYSKQDPNAVLQVVDSQGCLLKLNFRIPPSHKLFSKRLFYLKRKGFVCWSRCRELGMRNHWDLKLAGLQ